MDNLIQKDILVSALINLRERECKAAQQGKCSFYNAAITDILDYLGVKESL